MTRPSLWDKFLSSINPSYLYPHQLAHNSIPISAQVLHKTQQPKQTYWKAMDNLTFKAGSIFRYLGSVKSLNCVGDVSPSDHIFEVVTPILKEGQQNKLSNGGDTIAISKSDRIHFLPNNP